MLVKSWIVLQQVFQRKLKDVLQSMYCIYQSGEQVTSCSLFSSLFSEVPPFLSSSELSCSHCISVAGFLLLYGMEEAAQYLTRAGSMLLCWTCIADGSIITAAAVGSPSESMISSATGFALCSLSSCLEISHSTTYNEK